MREAQVVGSPDCTMLSLMAIGSPSRSRADLAPPPPRVGRVGLGSGRVAAETGEGVQVGLEGLGPREGRIRQRARRGRAGVEGLAQLPQRPEGSRHR